MLSEVGIRPALLICIAVAHCRSLLLFSQNSSQSAADKSVCRFENIGIRMFKITKPAAQHRVQAFNDALNAIPTGALGSGSDAIPQRFQAFLAYPAFASLESIAQKLKALSWNQTISYMCLVRVKAQTVLRNPGTYLGKCRLSRSRTRTHHNKVVGIANHVVAFLTHQTIERMQIQIGQKRADHCPLRCAAGGRPAFKVADHILLQIPTDQIKQLPVADVHLHRSHQALVWNGIEVARQVRIHNMRKAFLDQAIHFSKSILATTLRAKTVARFLELIFENRLYHHLQCGL